MARDSTTPKSPRATEKFSLKDKSAHSRTRIIRCLGLYEVGRMFADCCMGARGSWNPGLGVHDSHFRVPIKCSAGSACGELQTLCNSNKRCISWLWGLLHHEAVFSMFQSSVVLKKENQHREQLPDVQNMLRSRCCVSNRKPNPNFQPLTRMRYSSATCNLAGLHQSRRCPKTVTQCLLKCLFLDRFCLERMQGLDSLVPFC